MDAQLDFVTKQLARLFEGFIHLARVGSPRGILEADAGIGHPGIENLAQYLDVERRIVRARATARQFHHGHDDFVLQARVNDAFSGINQIIDIVERIEIADAGNAVFLEHLGVQIDHVGRLLPPLLRRE